jgi:hypothetical protein
MTLRTISQFKSQLKGGGARPNLFEVSIPTMPTGVTWDAGVQLDFQFLCEATSMPASTVNPIDIPFRGRILKVAGDRTIEIWSVTVINDENFSVRTAFEQWANLISKLDDATGVTNPTSYMANAAYVRQLGRGQARESTTNAGGSQQTLRTYKLIDLWPSNVGPIDLSYGDSNQIERFTVDFQMQYFEIGESGDANSTSIK